MGTTAIFEAELVAARIPAQIAASSRARQSHHYPQLDALRGLAALVVVLAHFVHLWEPGTLSHRTRFLLENVFLPVFNGQSSVTLFFLLSGFVLTLPYKRRNELPYPTFLLRRLARIYLPYLAALAVALIGDSLLHQPLEVSRWFSQTWTAPLTPSLILQHILLIGSYDTAQVNTAFWSLAVEMRLSILFPLLCIPLLRGSRLVAGLILGSVMVVDGVVPHLLGHRASLDLFHSLSDTTLGLFAFAAGIVLARALEPLQALWIRVGTGVHVLLFAASFSLLEWLSKLGNTRFWILENVLTIAGGCGVLLCVLCSRRAFLALNRRLPAWLGRVSYSLYLVHATVLFTLVHLFLGRLTRIELLVPYLACALGLATLFFLLIEKPSIHLSRSIGRPGRPFPVFQPVGSSRKEAPAAPEPLLSAIRRLQRIWEFRR